MLCLVAGVVSAAYAQGGEDARALMAELLDLSGLKRQIAQFPSFMQAGALQGGVQKLKPTEAAKVNQAIAEVFRPDPLYRMISEQIGGQLPPGHLSSLLAWYRSPLGKRLSELEVQATTPQALQEMQRFSAQLQRKPAAPERLALIRKLDQAARATDAAIEMVVVSFRGMAKALDPALPPEKRLKPGELDRLTARLKAEFEAPLRAQSLTAMLYTYQSVPDSEISEYVAFLQSEAGTAFTKASNAAFIKVVADGAEQLVMKIRKILPAPVKP